MAGYELVSVHVFRRMARKHERDLEFLLEKARVGGSGAEEARAELRGLGVPAWAGHARVRKYDGPRRGRWSVQVTP